MPNCDSCVSCSSASSFAAQLTAGIHLTHCPVFGVHFSDYHLQGWRDLYTPDFTKMADARREELRQSEDCQISGHLSHGYFAIVETVEHPLMNQPPDVSGYQDRRIFVVWDMFGKEVDPNSSIETMPMRTGNTINRDILLRNYTLQVEAGLIDPTVTSPFAGQPKGPVVVDSTPRERPLQANKYNQGYVTVRPMDDPSNPYAGQYDPWDYWMHENAKASDPNADAYFQQAALEYSQKVNKYRVAGKEIPKDLKFDASYTPDPNDPWQHYRITLTSAGWIIPYRIARQERMGRRFAQHDLREFGRRTTDNYYRLDAGGIMDEAMRAEYSDIDLSMQSDYYPQIPDWLATQPVQLVVFIPNGDIVTQGPLGWFPENAGELGKEELWADTEPGWYRYNSSGKLVDQYLTSERDWLRLYHDDRGWLVSDTETRGLETRDTYGFLIIRESDSGPIEAIFDYDGTQLDPALPVNREPGLFSVMRWHTIIELVDYRARAAGK